MPGADADAQAAGQPGAAASARRIRAGIRTDAHIGRELRSIRKSVGITQSELADRVGIGRERISRIENGRHSTSIALLSRVFYALGYTIGVVPIPTHDDLSRPTDDQAQQ